LLRNGDPFVDACDVSNSRGHGDALGMVRIEVGEGLAKKDSLGKNSSLGTKAW
jgi:hypothetical protein